MYTWALIEATAFGTRKIVETFGASGVPVAEFVAAGGLLKNEFLMQTYADILRMPVHTCASGQAPALGSAIHAAVAAGAYPDVTTAGDAMGGRSARRYLPDKAAADTYDRLYAEYTQLHDYFGRGVNEVMHRLHAMRAGGRARRGDGRVGLGDGRVGREGSPEVTELVTEAEISQVRSDVARLHAELVRYGLAVVWTGQAQRLPAGCLRPTCS